MKFSISLLLLSLLAFTGCTSVKVNKVAQGKLPKAELRQVRQLSVEAVQARPHEKIATIDMRTRSPFAANLTQLARERTAKLGGDAYSILSGNSQTTVSGGMGSLFGDSTSATMSIAVIRWTDVPPPEPKPGKSKKPEAAPESSAPATAEQPAPRPKKKPWWKPWAKSEAEPKPAPAEKPAPVSKPAPASKPKPAASQPVAAEQPAPKPKTKPWWNPLAKSEPEAKPAPAEKPSPATKPAAASKPKPATSQPAAAEQPAPKPAKTKSLWKPSSWF